MTSESKPIPPLCINELEYLETAGLNVMLAHDYYPEGHQGGVVIIQNGLRVATNGDLRIEPAPGQWSPIPKAGKREVDRATNELVVHMEYPDEARNRKGFNPIEYPDLHISYTLRVRPEGQSFRVLVDLDQPIPPEWDGHVGFNLEFYPASLFGKSFCTETGVGMFPRQPGETGLAQDGPSYRLNTLATGRRLTLAPEDDLRRITIESRSGGNVCLIDGRGLHNNGWYVVRSVIGSGPTKGALEWIVTPSVVPDWRSTPTIQVSQVGYHPRQQKVAVIELDKSTEDILEVRLVKIDAEGDQRSVKAAKAEDWGRFLRYRYLRFDFTDVTESGIYLVAYGDQRSSVFRIAPEVFTHGVWQPTVECFLPVQMCHMRVNENYRVWHGLCHMDDATMAPVDFNHIDGYQQGPSTLCPFSSGDHVPGLDRGGWHDAGDYDLRVESQADTVHGLALAYEEFCLNYDNTTVDQAAKVVEMLRPDGKPDVLQQIEHGCLGILGPFRALGRLCRGIIEPTLRQYVHLGDACTVTDNVTGTPDDRWVFTEENPRRELSVSGALAAASRVLSGFNDGLASECLAAAEALYDRAAENEPLDRMEASFELYRSTGNPNYQETYLGLLDRACSNLERHGWLIARGLSVIDKARPGHSYRERLTSLRSAIEALESKTPYGIPYEPHIWGAGWGIQRFGVQQYWLHRALPLVFPLDSMLHALSFVLGCHPGSNTASFVSGVGAKSMIPGYGVNRADESYIPGGIGSGTALIRPDYPELLEWPFLWQQTEYCVGYPTSDFVFLVAAADHLLSRFDDPRT
ncbi:MAG: glycoside hydrolase family 9 protein [Fimbriimonas sp.]|nr:glycoside hydrolase family 9 protein [Fimbriimonas sp.]